MIYWFQLFSHLACNLKGIHVYLFLRAWLQKHERRTTTHFLIEKFPSRTPTHEYLYDPFDDNLYAALFLLMVIFN